MKNKRIIFKNMGYYTSNEGHFFCRGVEVEYDSENENRMEILVTMTPLNVLEEKIKGCSITIPESELKKLIPDE